MYDLLDRSNPRNKRFVEELLKKWTPPQRQISIPNDVQVKIPTRFFKEQLTQKNIVP